MHVTPPPSFANDDLPPGVSVVVPVYNSEGTLAHLAARLEPVLRAATAATGLTGATQAPAEIGGPARAPGPAKETGAADPRALRFELILVNDGSRDGSWRIVRDLRERHAWVRGIDLMRNFGQHNALLCGVRAARFATIVTIDDDLQNPPEEIGTLLGRLDEPAAPVDVVYGAPRRQQH